MTTNNLYLNARREWDERYGDALSRARNWRIAAIVAMGVAGIAVAGVAYIGAQSKIQPFVVAIDSLGNPVAMARPSSAGGVTDRIIQAQIANLIWNARTILSDQAAQKVLLARVYAFLSTDSSAYLNDYYKNHSPFSDGSTANVEINSVLPISKDSYQINWTETRFQNGQSMGSSHWKASVSVGTDKKLADKPRMSIDNPLGIYIKSITWTQVLGNQ